MHSIFGNRHSDNWMNLVWHNQVTVYVTLWMMLRVIVSQALNIWFCKRKRIWGLFSIILTLISWLISCSKITRTQIFFGWHSIAHLIDLHLQIWMTQHHWLKEQCHRLRISSTHVVLFSEYTVNCRELLRIFVKVRHGGVGKYANEWIYLHYLLSIVK